MLMVNILLYYSCQFSLTSCSSCLLNPKVGGCFALLLHLSYEPGELSAVAVLRWQHHKHCHSLLLHYHYANCGVLSGAKLTTVRPAAVVSAVDDQQPADNIINATSHVRAVASSVTLAASSPSASPTQRPLSTSPQPSKAPPPPPPHAGRKRHQLTVSAAVARSRLLWSTAGVQGAIVALTLGIVVSVLTLAYIACHYRHQRKLGRRHRHLPTGSNDADYLVNGMYLWLTHWFILSAACISIIWQTYFDSLSCVTYPLTHLINGMHL